MTDDLTRAEKLADMTAEMALEADTEIEAGACRSHADLLRRLVARCREAEDVVRRIAEGEADVRAGRTRSLDDTLAHLRANLGSRGITGEPNPMPSITKEEP